MPKHSIVQVLDDVSIIRRSPELNKRAVAIYDILESNYFAPTGRPRGPFHLYLRIEDHSRLVLDIRSEQDRESLREIGLPLLPLERLVRDYFQICESC